MSKSEGGKEIAIPAEFHSYRSKALAIWSVKWKKMWFQSIPFEFNSKFISFKSQQRFSNIQLNCADKIECRRKTANPLKWLECKRETKKQESKRVGKKAIAEFIQIHCKNKWFTNFSVVISQEIDNFRFSVRISLISVPVYGVSHTTNPIEIVIHWIRQRIWRTKTPSRPSESGKCLRIPLNRHHRTCNWSYGHFQSRSHSMIKTNENCKQLFALGGKRAHEKLWHCIELLLWFNRIANKRIASHRIASHQRRDDKTAFVAHSIYMFHAIRHRFPCTSVRFLFVVDWRARRERVNEWKKQQILDSTKSTDFTKRSTGSFFLQIQPCTRKIGCKIAFISVQFDHFLYVFFKNIFIALESDALFEQSQPFDVLFILDWKKKKKKRKKEVKKRWLVSLKWRVIIFNFNAVFFYDHIFIHSDDFLSMIVCVFIIIMTLAFNMNF